MPEVKTLDKNTPEVQYLCKKDKRLAKLIDLVGPITYSPHIDNAYAFLLHEIVEQMLSAKAGQKIYNRLEDLCGGNVTPEAVHTLTNDQIKNTGTSSSKVKAIRNVTDSLMAGDLDFDSLKPLSDDDVIKQLTALHGIGKWTAKMYLIFVLDRQDVLPLEDGAFLQTYRWIYKTNDTSPASIQKKCKKWKPYSSIASRFFYRALDMGMAKKEFHLYKGET